MDGFICKFERYIMKKYGWPPRMYNIGILLLYCCCCQFLPNCIIIDWLNSMIFIDWFIGLLNFNADFWLLKIAVLWWLLTDGIVKSGGDGLYKKVSPLDILISLFYVIKCRHRSFMFRIIFKNNDKVHTLIKDVIVKICNQSKLKSIKDKHHFLLGRFDSHPRVIVNLLLTIALEYGWGTSYKRN